MFRRRIKKQFTIRASDDGNLLHPNEGTPINTSSHKSSVRLGNDNSEKTNITTQKLQKILSFVIYYMKLKSGSEADKVVIKAMCIVSRCYL